MKARVHRQPRHYSPRSSPFPWRRLIIALALSLLLAFGTLLLILSTGHVISTYWYYILPPIFVFVGILIPLLQWLFPVSSEDTTHRSSQSQQPPSTYLTTH